MLATTEDGALCRDGESHKRGFPHRTSRPLRCAPRALGFWGSRYEVSVQSRVLQGRSAVGSHDGVAGSDRPSLVKLRLRLGGCPVAAELVRAVLADHPREGTISLLAISVSHLEERSGLQLDLPLGLEDEKRRPRTKIGIARWMADRAVDVIRGRFGWHSIGYGSVALELSRSVPGEFRELAEKDF